MLAVGEPKVKNSQIDLPRDDGPLISSGLPAARHQTMAEVTFAAEETDETKPTMIHQSTMMTVKELCLELEFGTEQSQEDAAAIAMDMAMTTVTTSTSASGAGGGGDEDGAGGGAAAAAARRFSSRCFCHDEWRLVDGL